MRVHRPADRPPVRDIIWLPTEDRTMRAVANRIARNYGITHDQLLSGWHKKTLAVPRQHAMWQMRRLGKSTTQIARFFGLKNHTTVIHGARQHERRLRPHPIQGVRGDAYCNASESR